MAKVLILYLSSRDKEILDELFNRYLGRSNYLHFRYPAPMQALESNPGNQLIILSAEQPSIALDAAYTNLLSVLPTDTLSMLASDFANSGVNLSTLNFDLVINTTKGLQAIAALMQQNSDLVTDIKRLRLSSRRYKSMMNNIRGCYFSCKNDSDWTMLELSSSFEKLSGYSADDVILNKNLAYSDLILPQDRENVWLHIQQAIRQRKTYEVKYRMKTISGKIRYISETGFASQGNGGGSVIEGIIIDATHTQRLEMQLETIKKIILLSHNTHSLTELTELIKEELADVFHNSKSHLAFYDRSVKAFMVPVVEKGEAFFNKQDLDKTLDALVVLRNRSMIFSNGEILKLKRQGKLRSDHPEPKVYLGVPLSIDGKAHGIISIQNHEHENALDKTDLILLEFIAVQIAGVMLQKVASDEANVLVEAIAQNPEAITIIDLDGRIIYANLRAMDISGLNEKKMIGSLPAILDTDLNSMEQVQQIWDALEQHKQWEGEFQNKDAKGEPFWEFALIAPLKNHQDHVTNYIYVQECLTERKKAEAELIVARRRAEESDKLKTAFLSNISHEIRTPMNAIIGFAEMLATDNYSFQDHDEFIKLILENGYMLINTIDEIIDIAQVEAGQFHIEAAKCSANKILYDNYYNLKTLQQKYDKENLKLIANQHRNNENVIFLSDAHRINQIINNLIENALKYTFEGFIELGYQLLREEGTEYICFYVKDSGTGIAVKQIETIFDSFRQATDNYMSTKSSNGLGLAISRNVARLMGGDLRVESKIGKGSIFYFMLPLKRAKAEITEPANAEPSRESSIATYPGKTVLIAEDEDSNFKLLEVMLQKTKVNIHRAFNGRQAVDWVIGGNVVDLVLMDIRMPLMNGIQATEHIKAYNPKLPVIIQTAFVMSGDRTTGLAAGCDEYLPKPIRASDVYRLLQKFL